MTSMPLIVCGLAVVGLAFAWRAAPTQRATHLFVTAAMAVMAAGGDSPLASLTVLSLCPMAVALSNPWRDGCSRWHPVGCAAGMAVLELDMLGMLGGSRPSMPDMAGSPHSSMPGMAVTAVFLLAASVQLRHVIRRQCLRDAAATLAGSLAMVAMCASMLDHA